MRVGTTPLDLNAATTAAEDCADMPTGEQLVARLSTGVGDAKATVAERRREKIFVSCIVANVNWKINSLPAQSGLHLDLGTYHVLFYTTVEHILSN